MTAEAYGAAKQGVKICPIASRHASKLWTPSGVNSASLLCNSLLLLGVGCRKWHPNAVVELMILFCWVEGQLVRVHDENLHA